jgi:outer membrane biosynthesis protein TonB
LKAAKPPRGPLPPSSAADSPTYRFAKRARIQGVVILECVINPQGRVENVKVLRGPATSNRYCFR